MECVCVGVWVEQKMKTFVCSSPSPSLFFVNNHHSNSSSSQFLQLKSTHQHNKVSPFICLSSSTSFSSSVVDEQQDSPPPSSSISESFDDDNSDLDAFPLNFRYFLLLFHVFLSLFVSIYLSFMIMS